MKKLLFVISFALVALTFHSCSNSDDLLSQNESQISTVDEGYRAFLETVDSVNAYFVAQNPTVMTKGIGAVVADQTGIKKRADSAGGTAGGWLGKRTGAALGSLTGNPVGTIVGAWGGKVVGRIVGASLASYAVSWAFDHGYDYLVSRGRSKVATLGNGNPAFIVDYYIPADECPTLEDSIGYVHNQIMAIMGENPEKYMTEDGCNLDLMYEDCVLLAKQYGMYNDTITSDESFKEDAIQYASNVAQLACEVKENQIDVKTFDVKTIESLQNLGVPKEDVSIYKDYVLSVADMCDVLSAEERKAYAEELNSAIERSSMSEEQKKESRNGTLIVVNSSLHWDKK